MKKIFSLLMVSLMALSLSAEKVYFVNTPGWANVKVYAWGGSGTAMDWPGVDAVKLEDKINDFDVYEFSADPGSYANCIFNNGAGTQTKDLDWNAGKYFYNDAWYAKEDIPAVVPPVDPGENMTVHFVNKAGWEVVNAFVWPAEGDAYKVWPGEAMTKEAEKINDFDVFEYTFPALHVNIIFNNGKDQTDDLVWDAAKPYFYDGKWYAKEDIPAVVPPVDPGENMTVHFVNKVGWEVVNAFVWPATGDAYKVWPGEAMTKEAEKINDFDVFEYTFPATNVNIIFNNGKDQTDDLVWDAAKPYFYDGKWYAKEDIPAVEPPVDPGENMTVHFVNKAGWEVVNAFVWPAEGDAYKVWPGEAMTKEAEKINDFDVFEYTFPATNVNIIFNNGKDQTEDLVWDAAKPYFYDGKWYAKEDIPAVEPPVDPGENMTVHFVNKAGWEVVNAFVWPATGDAYKVWPGEAMTKEAEKINDFDVFEYTFPAANVNIIFNNGKDQTEDLKWDAAKPYFYDGKWYAKEDIPAVEPPVDPGENMTVHFVNKAGWEVVNAFVWPATGDAYKVWPGEAMTKEAEKINDFDVFEYTFPATNVNIIFNNGKDQTDDLIWDAAKPYFYDGKWYAKEDIPAVEPPVDPGENITVHFVNQAGWEVVNAYVWPAEGDAYKVWPGEAMTKEAEKINDFDVFEYTFPALHVNIIFNNGKDQTDDLVWDAAKPYFYDGKWYAKADIPAVEPPVDPGENMTVHFVNKAGWEVVNAFVWPAEGDAYKVWPGEAMTKEAEKINDFDVFEYTFPALHVNIIFNNGKDQTDDLVWDAAKPYFYDGKWYAKEDIPAVEPPVDPGENMTVHFVNKAGWEVVNAYVWPAEGDAYKAWPGEAMTKEEEKINDFDVYSYTFPAANINIIFNNGTNQTVNLVWDAAKLYFVINAAAASSESQFEGQWYAKEDIPAVEPEVPNGFYLVGTFNDWKPSAEYAFVPNPDAGEGVQEFMVTVELHEGDKLKGLAVLNGVRTWYPEGDDIVVPAQYAGICTIYFRIQYNPEWAELGGHIYIEKKPGQGIDAILLEGKAVKVLREGKLLIMKGSHSYTPMGQIVK